MGYQWLIDLEEVHTFESRMRKGSEKEHKIVHIGSKQTNNH